MMTALTILIVNLLISTINADFFSPAIPMVTQSQASGLIGSYNEALNYLNLNLPLGQVHPLALMTTPEILVQRGYPAESHNITTPDGYVLTYHRIPHGKTSIGGNRPCVFVMHGLFSESTHWIYAANDSDNLPMVLANNGYDVWLGNARGNRYALTNVNFPPSDPRFWNFDFHDMGLYDLPSGIDYITGVCGQSSIFYLGHSMGTTMFYVMASLLPQYNAKIRLMMSYAPVAYINHMTSPIRVFSPILGSSALAPALNAVPSPFTPDVVFQLVQGFVIPPCSQNDIVGKRSCFAAYCAIIGCDYTQFNKTLLPVYVHTYPSSTSSLPIYHYLQEVNCIPPCFQEYLPNVLSPPTPYDLSKITAPVALFAGYSDQLADFTDVQNLAGKLPNVVLNGVVSYQQWAHLDFVLGINASYYVYQPTVGLMSRF